MSWNASPGIEDACVHIAMALKLSSLHHLLRDKICVRYSTWPVDNARQKEAKKKWRKHAKDVYSHLQPLDAAHALGMNLVVPHRGCKIQPLEFKVALVHISRSLLCECFNASEELVEALLNEAAGITSTPAAHPSTSQSHQLSPAVSAWAPQSLLHEKRIASLYEDNNPVSKRGRKHHVAVDMFSGIGSMCIALKEVCMTHAFILNLFTFQVQYCKQESYVSDILEIEI